MSRRLQHLTSLAICCTALMSVVLWSVPAFAVMDFTAHGYYRVRGMFMDDLDLQKPNTSIPNSNDRNGFIAFNQMRLRLEPTLKVNDNLAIYSQFDFLDNILFGQNVTQELNVNAPVIGTLALPPGAGSFSVAGGQAGVNGSLNVRGIWAEILTPVGLFRLGRQPSQWGLGIFNNDGRCLQCDFGDFADRIMYLMQYDLDQGGSVSAGLLWDIPFESQFDPRLGGFNSPMPSNSRDTNQWAAVLMYDQPEFTLGVFGGYRRRNGPNGDTTMTVNDALGNPVQAGIDGKTGIYFADLYARVQYEQYRFQFEGVYIGGKVSTGLATNGLPFTGIGAANPADPCGTGGIICLPPDQSMRVFMAAFEADAEYSFGGSWNAKAGFAQGDSNVLSSRITEFGFRPDYQIALLLFHEPLGSSPQMIDSSSGQLVTGGVPITTNYINNALYFSGGYLHRIDLDRYWPGAQWVKIGAQVTTAWAPSKNINANFASLTGTPNLPIISETTTSMWQRWYGVEADFISRAKFFEHLILGLEGGVLIPGREYNVEVSLFDPGSIVSPIPQDKAEMAWIARLTAVLEF